MKVYVRRIEDDNPFYWSVASMSRALRFAAESEDARSYTLKSVANYYSIFHLSCFSVFLSSVDGFEKVHQRIANDIQKGVDPRRSIQHWWLREYLTEQVTIGAPRTSLDTFEMAREIREFVNYGPNLEIKASGLVVNNRQFDVSECEAIRQRLCSLFDEVVSWLSHTHSQKAILPTAIDKTAPFFVPMKDNDSNPFYREWSSQQVLNSADEMRAHLFDLSSKIVHPR